MKIPWFLVIIKKELQSIYCKLIARVGDKRVASESSKRFKYRLKHTNLKTTNSLSEV